MTTKFVSPGATIAYNNGSTARTSNEVIALGGTAGNEWIVVALQDIAANTTGSVATQGIFSLAALSTGVWVIGDDLYWDKTNAQLTDTSATGANPPCGRAAADKANGATTASVLLNAAQAAL